MRYAVLLGLAACLGCTLLPRRGEAAGSGRAFPIDAENYVTEQFTRINPSLQWDPTNFLVDLSGHYANCDSIGTRGAVSVDRVTPEGSSIIGAVDYTDGSRSDVDAVNDYIRTVIDRWVSTQLFNGVIVGANRFGCSVRPGCSGKVSVSCLFSNSGASNRPIADTNDRPGGQNALAFTPEQYDLAEQITGNRWDRSHFLENLSGYETDCAMIGSSDWPFTRAISMADEYGMRVIGTHGSARNLGSTPDALVSILNRFKVIHNGRQVGCSLIPDCMLEEGTRSAQMYVVVSCLYEEGSY